MISFENDYTVGAHPSILEKLAQTNLEEQVGYGNDEYSIEARNLLQEKIKNKDAKIFFLSGGTQTNLIALDSLLRSYEAVISAKTGHIFVHETGAIEATGHKVIPVNTEDGILTVKDIDNIVKEHFLYPHVVKPRIVYISNTTELGTIYNKKQLTDISNYCKQNDLLLYMDGARLGTALMAENNDLTLPEIAQLVDVFYIGGTKNGALLGEALVFNNPALADGFEFFVKQRGAMLAKGRIMAIQFLELFKNDLYYDLAKHSNIMAKKLFNAIKECGYDFLTETTTNLLFPILPKTLITALGKKYLFSVEEKDETHSIVRFVTSWGTKENYIDELIADIKKLS